MMREEQSHVSHATPTASARAVPLPSYIQQAARGRLLSEDPPPPPTHTSRPPPLSPSITPAPGARVRTPLRVLDQLKLPGHRLQLILRQVLEEWNANERMRYVLPMFPHGAHQQACRRPPARSCETAPVRAILDASPQRAHRRRRRCSCRSGF
jgi:hypothetical protein